MQLFFNFNDVLELIFNVQMLSKFLHILTFNFVQTYIIYINFIKLVINEISFRNIKNLG